MNTEFVLGADFRESYITVISSDPTTKWGPSKLYDLRGLKDVRIYSLDTELLVRFTSTKGPNTIRFLDCNLRGGFQIRAPFASVFMEHCSVHEPSIIEPEQRRCKVTLEKTSFYKHLIIVGCELGELNQVHIEPEIDLVDMDVTKALFEKTDLKRVNFVSCTLADVLRPRLSVFRRKTKGLYGETKYLRKAGCRLQMLLESIQLLWNRNEDIKKVSKDLAEQYRGITANFEDRRRHELSGKFYAGECEMRRVHGGIRDKVILSLYRYVSFYNESWLRPLILLVAVLPLISGLFFAFAGVPIDENVCRIVLIWSTDRLSYDPKTAENVVNTILRGIGLAYTSLSLIPTDEIKELHGWSRVVLIFTRICGAILLPTFLFALRRRYRR
jgi:hypothetical protein